MKENTRLNQTQINCVLSCTYLIPEALGTGDSPSSIPAQIGNQNNWETISAGGNYSISMANKDLWSWGSNSKGQLGDGANIDRDLLNRVEYSATATNQTLNKNFVKIYPTLAVDYLNIKSSTENFDDIKYEIHSIDGQTIKSRQNIPQLKTIDVANLA